MNPINLLLPDGAPSRVWACGECKITRVDQEHAEKCCTLVPCKVCGWPTDKKFRATYVTETCDACRTAEGQRKDAERLAKAEKLEAWDDWVYADHGPNDGFFEDVGAYVDWLVDEGEDPGNWPDWVYAAKSRPGCVLDIGRILEDACDDGYEDMDEDLKGVKELEAAIKVFNEANEGVVVYEGDFKRAVRVPKPTTALSPTEATPATDLKSSASDLAKLFRDDRRVICVAVRADSIAIMIDHTKRPLFVYEGDTFRGWPVEVVNHGPMAVMGGDPNAR